uniref:SMP domain-containing protein n=1 Tax=Oryza punctata TaxID=4537 RepID=A0A0E0LVW6_ORYPU
MAGHKVVFCTCILIFIVVVISGQAEARRLAATAAANGNEPCNEDAVAVEGDGSFRAVQENASSASTDHAAAGRGGAAAAVEGSMPMTTTDSRPTAPGNSPGIGNKGRINN